MALVKKRIEKEYLVCDCCGAEVREIDDEDKDSWYKDFCRKCKKGLCPQCLTPIGIGITENKSIGQYITSNHNTWLCPECADELVKYLNTEWGVEIPRTVKFTIFNKKNKKIMNNTEED